MIFKLVKKASSWYLGKLLDLAFGKEEFYESITYERPAPKEPTSIS